MARLAVNSRGRLVKKPNGHLSLGGSCGEWVWPAPHCPLFIDLTLNGLDANVCWDCSVAPSSGSQWRVISAEIDGVYTLSHAHSTWWFYPTSPYYFLRTVGYCRFSGFLEGASVRTQFWHGHNFIGGPCNPATPDRDRTWRLYADVYVRADTGQIITIEVDLEGTDGGSMSRYLFLYRAYYSLSAPDFPIMPDYGVSVLNEYTNCNASSARVRYTRAAHSGSAILTL